MRAFAGPVVVTLAFGVSFLAPPAAADFAVSVGDVRVDTAYVRLDFELLEPLPPPDSAGAYTPPPAALAFTVELWRDRSSWFDALVSQRTWGYRLEFDHIRGLYRVALPDGSLFETARREEVERRLAGQVDVIAARLEDLDPGKTYYLAVTARRTPIDLERLDELDAWMSGEIRPRRKGGGLLAVPKGVVGFLADVAGLGDRASVSRSARFRALPGGGILVLPVDD